MGDPENPADPVARLTRLDTCAVSDALDSLGIVGALPGIHPLWPCGRMAGRARTVLLRPAGEGPDRPGPHLGATAVDRAAPGEVVVVANRGRVDSAAWGGLLCAAASRRGVAGVVVDGACRDVEEAVDLGFPVFARGATPVSARGRTVEEATDVAIPVAGVTVAPGDLVLADRSGVVVVPRAAAEEVLDAAERIAGRERAMLADLRAGAAATEVMGRSYETMLRAVPDGVADGSVGEG